MPYNFNTIESDSAIFRLKVRVNADAYTLTAEFTEHAYDKFDPETPFFTAPVESSGNDLTIRLSSAEVDLIKTAYYRIRAVNETFNGYVESGKIVYSPLPSTVEIKGDDLIVLDPFGREFNAGYVRGPQGPQGLKGDKGDKGEQGIQGFQGQQGIQGMVGPAGLEWKGTWLPESAYDKDDAVYYDGSSWFSSSAIPAGTIPSLDQGNDWQPLAIRGAQGIQGQQGIQGIQGIQGVKGDIGDMSPAVSANAVATFFIDPGRLPGTRNLTLTQNLSVTLGTGFPADKSGTITLVLKQAATGGPYTVAWATAIEWASDATGPAMPTVANAELIVHLFWTGFAWRGMLGGTFFP